MTYTVSSSSISFHHATTVSEIKNVLTREAYRLRDARQFSLDFCVPLSHHYPVDMTLDIAALADILETSFAHADNVSIRNARVSNVDALGRIAARAKRLSLCNIQLEAVRFKLCPDITHLDLSDNPIAFVDLTGYPQLRYVCLDRCPLETIDMDSDLETRCRAHNDGGGFSGVFVTPRITPSPMLGRQLLKDGLQMKPVHVTDKMTPHEGRLAVAIEVIRTCRRIANEFETTGNLCVDYIIQKRCQQNMRCDVLGVSYAQVFQIVWEQLNTFQYSKKEYLFTNWWTPENMNHAPSEIKQINELLQKRMHALHKKVKDCVHATPEEQIAGLVEVAGEFTKEFKETVEARFTKVKIVPAVETNVADTSAPAVETNVADTSAFEPSCPTMSVHSLDDDAHTVTQMYPPPMMWHPQNGYTSLYHLGHVPSYQAGHAPSYHAGHVPSYHAGHAPSYQAGHAPSYVPSAAIFAEI